MFDAAFEQPQYQRLASIKSYGRLHFGLVEIAPNQPQRFGGVGLMVDHSIAKMQIDRSRKQSKYSEVFPANRFAVHCNDAYWKSRIEQQLECWGNHRSENDFLRIGLTEFPVPHCGLGSGTQIACTVVGLLLASIYYDQTKQHSTTPQIEHLLDLDCHRQPKSPPEHLCVLSQRGRRSNVGLCGFLQGGFIFDHGQEALESPSCRLATRIAFPTQWPILLIQSSASGISGEEEMCLFEKCSTMPNPNRNRMLGMIREELIPSIQAADWKAFGSALGSYGRLAGQIFSAVQGGLYRTPAIAQQIAFLCSLGLESACQSSWGPTVCAFAQNDEHAQWVVERLHEQFETTTVQVVRANNQPACLEWA